jgi:hypothetical protein
MELATKKQLAYLRKLGWSGTGPLTREQAVAFTAEYQRLNARRSFSRTKGMFKPFRKNGKSYWYGPEDKWNSQL